MVRPSVWTANIFLFARSSFRQFFIFFVGSVASRTTRQTRSGHPVHFACMQNNQKLLFTRPSKWKSRSLHPSPSSPVGTSESVYPNPLKRRCRFLPSQALPVQKRPFFSQFYSFIFLSSTITHKHKHGTHTHTRALALLWTMLTYWKHEAVCSLAAVVAVSRLIAHRRRFDKAFRLPVDRHATQSI